METTKIANFLAGKQTDDLGRTLQEIWTFDDTAIERSHDFIQWVFPLTEPSKAVPTSPTLLETDITAIRSSQTAQNNMKRSADWFIEFLTKNDLWLRRNNHNHRRISRAIKSLRLLVGEDAAREFCDRILVLCDGHEHYMMGAIRHWLRAIE
jgi:hypothetical protein